ncbi:MAG: alpha-L-arabinofuranosidase C-terminal domain-containing protein [Candidatus Omnitrophota bacterium]
MLLKKQLKYIKVLLANFLIVVSLAIPDTFGYRCFASQIVIKVNSSTDQVAINKLIFGSNIIAYDPKTYETWHDWKDREYCGYSNFGAGIWDAELKLTVDAVIKYAQESGITNLRFPGGCGAHHYVWKNSIGKDRKNFLFGMDEFLSICEKIGVEPIITLSFFKGDETDKAALVEYLNLPDDGSHKWARERTKNGHSRPYGVKYFEIGNEDWHGDHQNVKNVSPADYAKRYLKYYQAIKAVDSKAQVGVVLWKKEWDKEVINIVGDKVDFGIIHTYPSPEVTKEKLADLKSSNIFAITLAVPVIKDDYLLNETGVLLKERSGKDVPLAITEYNGGFVQEEPVPYRHCLGTALVNAELLRVFMKPENNVLMANYWQFCNSYWGMIANGFDGTYKTLYNSYYKRPNYYVFEMYYKHFGDILLNADVNCDTYDASLYQPIKSLVKRIKTGTIIQNNLASGKWQITAFDGVTAIVKNNILEINSFEPKEFNYYHSRIQANIESSMYYKLSGYIKTEAWEDEVGVSLEVQDVRGWDQTKSAVSTEKIKGTVDWQYVEAVYETLPDAKGVNVIARRVGDKGPLKGKAYFKDIRLEKFVPTLDTKIPYLSVNVSKSKDGNKVYLMVINKNMDNSITSTISLQDFVSNDKGNAWVLNGPSVDATNEKDHDNVKINHRTFEIVSATTLPRNDTEFEFTFEPHSLTALEIKRKN